jgi:hypothetical protein
MFHPNENDNAILKEQALRACSLRIVVRIWTTSGLTPQFSKKTFVLLDITEMDGINAAELASRAIKYFLEGLAVAVAMTIIPRKVPNIEEILTVSVVASVVFAILDLLSPSIGLTSRQGAGLSLGSQLVGGFKMM